jgi:hypothetical protein
MSPPHPQTVAEPARIRRERRTISAMIRIYCRDRHGSRGPLCAECHDLQQYAMHRLDCCPYGSEKPTCVNCPIHCYKPDMRERVRQVMRYSGPKMLRRHPILALLHLFWDGRKQAPDRVAKHGLSEAKSHAK